MRALLALFIAGTMVACNGGGGSLEAGSSGDMDVLLVSNGFAQILPHEVFSLNSDGSVSEDLIDLREMSDLLDNVKGDNSVMPTPRLSPDPLGVRGRPFR